MNDQELADELYRSLRKRRYLVVIDHLWDVDLWKYFLRYFPNDKTPSRILITTRGHNVASETKSEIHELRALTNEESFTLLLKTLPPQEPLPENLERIAKEISKSCKGLPLSIVLIGGLMHNVERNEEMWNQISKDVTSIILSDPQEDHEISVTRLVRLWVAEGLLRGGATSKECVEDVGRIHVDDFITRSLVIPIKEKLEGGVQNIILHDLIRDFCTKKAKEEHFFSVLDDRCTFDLSLCPRRVSINHDMDKHLPFISLNSVRTIISFCEAGFLDGEIERIMKSEHMILLNVLDMHELNDLSSYIYHFVHLRYLAIWKIQCMDQGFILSSISKLWNLQTLILFFSGNHVFEVPESIWDLVKLRHIHLLPSALFPGHNSQRHEDSSVLLENLRSLSKPHLRSGDSNWLRKLPKLQKLSCIFFASSDSSLQKYGFPELDLCNQLTSLKVENGAQGNEREQRCKLHFPKSLRKLSLSKFILDSADISEIGRSLE